MPQNLTAPQSSVSPEHRVLAAAIRPPKLPHSWRNSVLFLGCFPAACCCLQPQCSTTAPKALDTQTVPVTHQIPNKTATLPPHKAFLFSFFFFFLRQSITPNYNVLFLALVQICVSPIMSPSGIDKSFTSPSGLLCQMRNCYIFTCKQLLMFNFLHKMLWKWRCNTPSSC